MVGLRWPDARAGDLRASSWSYIIKPRAGVPKPRARGYGGKQDASLQEQAEGERREQPLQRAGDGKRDPTAPDRRQHAYEAGGQWPKEPSRSLRGEVERKPQTEKAVAWTDQAQIHRAHLDHLRIGAELG